MGSKLDQKLMNYYNYPSLLKPNFHQNWDRGFGLRLFKLEPGDAIKQSDGVGLGPVSQRLDGGSPEEASVLKLRMMGVPWGRKFTPGGLLKENPTFKPPRHMTPL
jgi:hypothetical protein